ncbi:uncharacterized protein LOC121410306 [Lytechinus variegatus]|uniref:uncharacterized protein LOC121410306 n=1 Tax=Lytechinus variegatus TaxID=7654 RepID=UPI001BB25FA7|nr:uncharacterized protein LOC121410306 [Lytechinus variegatus]
MKAMVLTSYLDIILVLYLVPIGSASSITSPQQTDIKCCSWMIYLSLFILSCVITWFVLTLFVVSFYVYRRSCTKTDCIQRCMNKRQNHETKIEIRYQRAIRYDIATVPLLSDVNEFERNGQERCFGASMKDYISSKPPMPIYPNIESGSNKRWDPGLDDKHCDNQSQLWTYFTEKDISRERTDNN